MNKWRREGLREKEGEKKEREEDWLNWKKKEENWQYKFAPNLFSLHPKQFPISMI